MTQTQRDALAKMGNAGAIRIGNVWIWREDVRQSEEAARQVCEHFGKGCNGTHISGGTCADDCRGTGAI